MNLSGSYHVLFSLCWVFIATFIVFPAIFFDSHWAFFNEGKFIPWYILISILTFNICDTIGRKLGGTFMLSTGKVIAGSFLRTIFVLLALLIALDDKHDKYFFEADWFKILNLILFSISNGYIST